MRNIGKARLKKWREETVDKLRYQQLQRAKKWREEMLDKYWQQHLQRAKKYFE